MRRRIKWPLSAPLFWFHVSSLSSHQISHMLMCTDSCMQSIPRPLADQASRLPDPTVIFTLSLEFSLSHVGSLEASFHCVMFNLAGEINLAVLKNATPLYSEFFHHLLGILEFGTLLFYFPNEYFSLSLQRAHCTFCPRSDPHLRWCVLALVDFLKRRWWVRKRGLEIPQHHFFIGLLMVQWPSAGKYIVILLQKTCVHLILVD